MLTCCHLLPLLSCRAVCTTAEALALLDAQPTWCPAITAMCCVPAVLSAQHLGRWPCWMAKANMVPCYDSNNVPAVLQGCLHITWCTGPA
mgnify:CR=1 FL=1